MHAHARTCVCVCVCVCLGAIVYKKLSRYPNNKLTI